MSDIVDVKQITGTASTIQQLFSATKYGLDFYQREYAWTEANVLELIEDLTTRFLGEYAMDDERVAVARYSPYFLGPIVTSNVDGVRYLVDGQQRMTTLTLLLIHLLHLVEDSDAAQAATIRALVHSTQYGRTSFNLDVSERAPVMESILEDREFDPSEYPAPIRNLWVRYLNIVESFPDELKDERLFYFIDWLLDRVFLVEIRTTDSDMALEVFETMNDRGLSLTPTDMLKSFLLARIEVSHRIEDANQLWRHRVVELTDLDRNADSDFLKTWLRAKYAVTIRETKKDAAPGDFDIIGSSFHKWVRDRPRDLGLHKPGDFEVFVNSDFERMSARYRDLLRASRTLTPGFEHLIYLSEFGFTQQYLPILAAVTIDDDAESFQAKTRLIGGYLDLMVARRMVNFRNIGYSALRNTIFNLAKELRDKDVDEVRAILADRVAGLEEGFDAVDRFRLTQRNKGHIRYLLARITSWVEHPQEPAPGFVHLVRQEGTKAFEVEHIWSNHPELHEDDFNHAGDFDEYRNRIGGLLLLPKSFNASYGDMPYAQKVEHYAGQNLLARSLHRLAYEHNPEFRRLREAFDLPFRPHPEFRRVDLDERQALYRAIFERVWDPEPLGLGGGRAPQSPEETRAAYQVTIADLIQAGLLAVGDRLVGNRTGVTYWATVLPDGLRDDGGRDYETPSAIGYALTGRSTNGWEFWSVAEGMGRGESLHSLRAEYLERSAGAHVDTE